MIKIEAITLREIRMPLVHFFETSFRRTYDRRILLLCLHCQGIEAWGECVAGEGPHYSEESIDTAWYVTREYFAPAILGKTLEHGRDCVPLFAPVRCPRLAKAAFDHRLWHPESN